MDKRDALWEQAASRCESAAEVLALLEDTDGAGWQDAAERSEARTAGRVPNILACEYADLPGQRKSLWPFLPWRTSYVFREGSWKPVNGA